MVKSKLVLLFVLPVLSVCCQTSTPSEHIKNVPSTQPIKVGAERLDLLLSLVNDKSIGLVVNHTSLVGDTHLVDTLVSRNINLKAVFSPEHGFRGKADAGERIEQQESSYPFRIESLYGKNKKPSTDQLSDIEVMIFDIQDVGVRFYTYISTMHYVMEACIENRIPLIILDRPNPNGSYVDGPVLDTTFRSFVGMHPIPIVHGLTVGELAKTIIGEKWIKNADQIDLTVIEVENWNHSLPYSLPVQPSPNLPNDLSIALYPSLCLFEGTIVSIGRGTKNPFQLFGHPNLKSDFSFTPISGFGSKYPKLEGEVCYGKTFEGTEPNYSFTLKYLIETYRNLNTDEEFFIDYFNLLVGNDITMTQIQNGLSEDEIKLSWQEGLNTFKEMRLKYLLYD